MTNGIVSLNLNNATDQVYEIWSADSLTNAVWNIEQEVWPTNQSCMPFTVAMGEETNGLFFYARDWTGITENGNATPDWWFYYYFGAVGFSDTDMDSQGNTLLYDYQNGLDPNVISFTLSVANKYAGSANVPMQLNVTAGTPFYMAALVDDTNWADAVWVPFNANLVADIGSTPGWHQIWVGARGLPTNATPSWNWCRVELLTPPTLVITNPISTTVSQPMIEIQGYSPQPLAGLSYDISNAAGLLTNQQAFVTGQYYEANTLSFTTNYFQAFDVPLTNGANVVTFHATDPAGQVTITNITYTVDYAGQTNPPVINLFWPQDGETIAGNSFTLRGSLDYFTATLTAQIVDANGDTNLIAGLVERNGLFWLENVPLSAGTNYITLTAMDAAGNISTTNLTVNNIGAALTVDDFSAELGGQPSGVIPTVTGTIALTNSTVWVNGVEATQNGDETWSATSVPVGAGGTAVVDVRVIPDSDNGGNGTGYTPSGGGSGSGSAQPGDGTPANPTAADSIAAELQIDQPSLVFVQDYNDSGTSTDVLTTCVGGTTTTLTASGSWGGDAGQFATNGTYHNSSHFSDSDGAYVDDITYTWSCDSCMATLTVVEGEEGEAGTNTYPARPLTGSWLEEFAGQWGAMAEFSYSEQLSKSYPPQSPPCTDPDTFTDSVGETICSQTTLLTGGKGVASQQILFEMGVSAEKYIPVTVPDGRGFGWNTQGIAPGQMTVAGKKVGYDGNLWTVLPSGTTVDITPQAPPPNYTYSVTASSYPIDVMASDGTTTYDLTTASPPPTFCVGEQITFSLSSSPPYTLAMVHWNLPDKYVNATQQTNSSGSVNYYINDSLLYNTAPPGSIGTQCWYINGTGGTVSATTTYTFANGQTVSIAPQGTFTMFRPAVTLPYNEIGHPRFFSVTPGSFGGATIKLGTPGQQADGEMYFTPLCQTTFSGVGEITQTCQLSYNPDPGGFNFSDWRLDGSINYAGPAGITAAPVPVHYPTLDDGPQNGTTFSTSSIELKGNFMVPRQFQWMDRWKLASMAG